MEELINLQSQASKHSVWDDYVPIIHEGRHIDIYLTDQIEAPSEYNRTCHLLNKAYEGDTITLHINSGGGYVDSGFAIIDAIKHTKARVTAHIVGTVASAATFIALACDDIEVADYVQFMIHNYSSGASGKGHEVRAQVEFSDKELNQAFEVIYGGFLTPHEKELVIAGKDLWMGKEEVLARWEARKTNDTDALLKIEAARKAK